MERTLYSVKNQSNPSGFINSRGWMMLKFSLITLTFTMFTTAWGQESMSSSSTGLKLRQAPQGIEQPAEINPVDLSNSLWFLHEEMSALTVKLNNAVVFKQRTDPSMIDFRRLCPNYPLNHFSEMDKEGILSWVQQYPSQAKALKEILEYVNSELKK